MSEAVEVHARMRAHEDLLRECSSVLCNHHDSRYMKYHGECPVCSKRGTESYPHNIFGRIEAALRNTKKPAESKAGRHILIAKKPSP